MQEYLLAMIFPLAKKQVKKIEAAVKKFRGKILDQEIREESLILPVKGETNVTLLKLFFALDKKNLKNLQEEIKKKLKPLRYVLVKFCYTKIKKDKARERVKLRSKKAKLKKEKKDKLDKALEKVLKE